jgi:hypothetical protein
VLALAVTAACLMLAAAVLWIIWGVLADKAADAEWRAIDCAHHVTGRDVAEALSREVRERHDRTLTLPPH